VFTLAAVEAPQIIVPAPWTDKKSDDEDGVPQVQQERSITKSLRTTVRHLYSVGGPFAMCRGMAVHISINIVAFALATPLFVFWAVRSFGEEPEDQETASSREMTLYSRLKEVLGNTAFDIVAGLVFCSWLAAWVHIVITQHTLRIWYRRLPPFLHTFHATWRPLVLLPLVNVLVRRTVVVLLKRSLGLYEGYESDAGTFTSRNMLLTLIWLVVQGMDLLIILPLEVAVVRIQASLLPEDEEPIIPFDRSFGTNGSNGLRPGLLAEARGPLSLKEAWQSLTWVEMRRLAKIFAKMLLVQAAVNALFWPAIGNSAWPDKWVPSRVY
jgi:glycosyltransferase involved in cell wall biosynthesis